MARLYRDMSKTKQMHKSLSSSGDSVADLATVTSQVFKYRTLPHIPLQSFSYSVSSSLLSQTEFFLPSVSWI